MTMSSMTYHGRNGSTIDPSISQRAMTAGPKNQFDLVSLKHAIAFDKPQTAGGYQTDRNHI